MKSAAVAAEAASLAQLAALVAEHKKLASSSSATLPPATVSVSLFLELHALQMLPKGVVPVTVGSGAAVIRHFSFTLGGTPSTSGPKSTVGSSGHHGSGAAGAVTALIAAMPPEGQVNNHGDFCFHYGRPPTASTGASATAATAVGTSCGGSHGLFTWYLLKGLQGDALRSGRITPSLLAAYIYRQLIVKLRPKQAAEAEGTYRSQLAKAAVPGAGGVDAADLVGLENTMFRFKDQLKQRKIQHVETECRFVVELSVGIAAMGDTRRFVDDFKRQMDAVFYPDRTKFYARRKCRVVGFFRTGQYTAFLDPNVVATKLSSFIREGSCDASIAKLTGAVFDNGAGDQLTTPGAVAGASDVANDKSPSSPPPAATSGKGVVVIAAGASSRKKGGGKSIGMATATTTMAARSSSSGVASSSSASGLVDAAAPSPPNISVAAPSPRSSHRPPRNIAARLHHFAPKYRLFHSQSCVLISTAYLRRDDDAGETDHVFVADDYRYRSNAVGPGDDGNETDEASPRGGGATTATSSPHGGNAGSNKSASSAFDDAKIYVPAVRYAPETVEIAARRNVHPDLLPNDAYDRYYVQNVNRIEEDLIVYRMCEKVFMEFEGCDRDFLQAMKHARMGSFTTTPLHQCVVLRVEYVHGTKRLFALLTRAQANARGAYARSVMKPRMLMATQEREARKKHVHAWLSQLQLLKREEVALRQRSYAAFEARLRYEREGEEVSDRRDMIELKMSLVQQHMEPASRLRLRLRERLDFLLHVGEPYMRDSIHEFAVLLVAKVYRGMLLNYLSEMDKRRRMVNIEESDRQKVKTVMHAERTRLVAKAGGVGGHP